MNKYFLFFSSLVLLFFLILKIVIPDFFIFSKNPRLIKGLSSEISVAEKQFNTRIQKTFFSKTTNSEISNELSRQGFIVESAQKGKMSALFQETNIVCNLIWLITWQVDNQGYIYNLEAKYNPACL
jgi:hypothetical protein